MDRRKKLKELYKEIPIESGVYQIRNLANEKIFVGSIKNLKRLNGIKFTLENGTSYNKELQKDFLDFGKDAFSFEVLEILKKKDDPYFNEKEELEKMEEKWLAELQPYGDRGYN